MSSSLEIFGKNAVRFVSKNSPTILTILGATGVISTTVSAVKATPKALEKIKLEEDYQRKELTKLEVVKLVWPDYIPTAVMGGLTIGCLVSLNSIHAKKYAALASVYSLTDATLREYQKKVKESIGEKKEQRIQEEIQQEKIIKDPPTESNVIFTGDGEHLCRDMYSGRYFKSDINKVKQAAIIINSNLQQDDFVSLNDYYYELGLENVDLGDELGWSSEDGIVKITYGSHLTPEKVPCLAISFDTMPKMDYM